MLLAYEMIDGSSLDGVVDDAVTDELMRGVWAQVAILREHRIAHRDLRRANVFVQDDGVPWLIDFGFSEVAVADEILDADVAQMLASFSVVVGAERAVRAAVESIGSEAVGQALAPPADGGTERRHPDGAQGTQGPARGRPGPGDRPVQRREGRVHPTPASQQKTIFTAVIIVLATYFLIPQFADLPGIVDQVKEANWAWTPLIILGSAMTYVAASVGLAGAIAQDLPTGPLFLSSVGSSFASKLAPAGLGGMAMNIRFLQKQGVDEPEAVSGVGLNTIAGVVGHIALIGVFIIWAGSDAFGSFRLPDPKWFIIALCVAAVVLIVSMAIPASRRIFLDRLLPVVTKAIGGVSAVLRRPRKVVMLVGGSAARDVRLPHDALLQRRVVRRRAAVRDRRRRVPGGLGRCLRQHRHRVVSERVEAALIAGLVSAGLDNTIAVPAVFMYRLFTFWVPILPGWISFEWLKRNEYI